MAYKLFFLGFSSVAIIFLANWLNLLECVLSGTDDCSVIFPGFVIALHNMVVPGIVPIAYIITEVAISIWVVFLEHFIMNKFVRYHVLLLLFLLMNRRVYYDIYVLANKGLCKILPERNEEQP